MFGLAPSALLAAAAAVTVAGAMRGFTGFGFALAAVPLVSLVVSPQRAVAAVLIIQTAIGLRDCILEGRRADKRAVLRLIGGALFGTPLGVLLLMVLPVPVVRLALGAMVVAAIASTWRPRQGSGEHRYGLAWLTGFASGVTNGLAAMSGPPVVVYFLACERDLAVMRSSMMAYFPIAAALALPMVAVSGLLDREAAMLGIAGLPLMWLGGLAGTWAFRRFGRRSYRPVATAALAFTALASIVKGLSQLL